MTKDQQRQHLHRQSDEQIVLDQGVAAVSNDTIGGSGNVGIEVVQYDGQSYAPLADGDQGHHLRPGSRRRGLVRRCRQRGSAGNVQDHPEPLPQWQHGGSAEQQRQLHGRTRSATAEARARSEGGNPEGRDRARPPSPFRQSYGQRDSGPRRLTGCRGARDSPQVMPDKASRRINRQIRGDVHRPSSKIMIRPISP